MAKHKLERSEVSAETRVKRAQLAGEVAGLVRSALEGETLEVYVQGDAWRVLFVPAGRWHPDGKVIREKPCSTCAGSGYEGEGACPTCGGSGA